MNNTQADHCPRLIEVAMPIREISAESDRDKKLRQGHLSTLHVWWARRPLAASRAIVFASLVPDPDDPRCPTAFKTAVERSLNTHVPAGLKHYYRGRDLRRDEDPYRPYEGIPDTLRNRLLMFIAKWSPESIAFEAGRSKSEPAPRYLLDDRALSKWETSDPQNPQGREILRIARDLVAAAHDGQPAVLDPFSGGGAIPLEAERLGALAIANDYNPVAHLILRATCEFPQKFGKPGNRVVSAEEFGTRRQSSVRVPNVLAHDVERWAKWILERARGAIGHLYPVASDGRPVVGYLWARTVQCSNPSCRGDIPLLRSLLICRKEGKAVALGLDVDKSSKIVAFRVHKGTGIKQTDGTKRERGPAICPFCGQPTSEDEIRAAGRAGRLGERMVAVIVEGRGGKDYRDVEEADLRAFKQALSINVDRPKERILPEVTGTDGEDGVSNSTGIRVHLYGMTTWGSLLNHRQLVAMQTFTDCLHEAFAEMEKEVNDDEYRKAVAVYLGLWISRNAGRMCTVGRWNVGGEKFETPFDGARLSMKLDYPEANPFSNVTGGFGNQLEWIVRFLEHEQFDGSAKVIQGDAASLPLKSRSAAVVVTDPPYFDEAAYADLSDYFYVWLKRALHSTLPDVFATPLTPKSDEATALKHRHGGDGTAADRHFRSKLAAAFTEAWRVCEPGGLMTVIFAHQETPAWVALIDALFSAGLTIDATWPIEMELKSRMRGLNSAALQTSITVTCRPRSVGGAASFREVWREIEAVVKESVKRFWSYGFRGADLIVACYGPAVGVFGKHERVEKADGTAVGIPELLDLARRSARDAIAGEFRGDNLSTLYYIWANLYGAAEQDWDDARLVVQVGGDADNAMEVARGQGIFVIEGSKVRLALLADRKGRKGLGAEAGAPLIDVLHRAMLLWQEEQRADLVAHLLTHGFLDDGAVFWKLGQALFEVLPRDSDDWKLVNALLTERQSLRIEGKRSTAQTAQRGLFVK
jgi:adenine-specific DNA methylase